MFLLSWGKRPLPPIAAMASVLLVTMACGQKANPPGPALTQAGATDTPLADGEPQPDDQAPAPRESVARSFAARAPQVGQQLPDVTIFDAQGNPFPLAQLRGHYTVLVFGCLT